MRALLLLLILLNFLHSCALCGGGKASFVNVETNTVIANSKLQKIEALWKFDEMTSASIISLYDKNKNRRFENDELHAMFTILSKAEKPSFMTVVNLDSYDKQIHKINSFNAYIKDKFVFYTFDITLDYPLKDKNTLVYYFLDSTGYLAFFHIPENIKIQNSGGYKVKKDFAFKVLPNIMTVVNTVSIEIKK